MIAFRAHLGAKLSGMLDKPAIQRAAAWVGLLGFMIGMPFTWCSPIIVY